MNVTETWPISGPRNDGAAREVLRRFASAPERRLLRNGKLGWRPDIAWQLERKDTRDPDARNLFPEAVRVIEQCQPRAVMIENVRGILDAVFDD